LPVGWERKRLSEVCQGFQYGSSRKSDKEGKVPVLRMGNLQDGEIDWTNLAYTSNDEEIDKYILQPNTVLFNRTNSPELVGKTALYRGQSPAVFAGYLIRILHGSELDPRYLNISLNAPEFREYCSQVRTDGVSQSYLISGGVSAPSGYSSPAL
jgi:type I restriction enzyme, S subunit